MLFFIFKYAAVKEFLTHLRHYLPEDPCVSTY